MADEKLSPTEREILDQFAKGRRLQILTKTEGWSDLIEIMDKRVEQAEYNLMNYNGIDVEALKALHRRARTMREFSQAVQSEALNLADNAVNIPQMLNKQDELDQRIQNYSDYDF